MSHKIKLYAVVVRVMRIIGTSQSMNKLETMAYSGSYVIVYFLWL